MIKKGFTLVELMIVMAVIAILMGLILPNFKGMKQEAQHARVQGDLRTLQTALESFFIHNENKYPAMGDNWQTHLVEASPKILKKLLFDPFSSDNRPYSYLLAGQYYAVWSSGFDGDGAVVKVDPQTGKLTLKGKPLLVTNGEEK